MNPYILHIKNLTDIEQKFSMNQEESDIFEIEKIGNPFQNFKHFQIQSFKRLITDDISTNMKICGEVFPLFLHYSALQCEPNLLNVDIEIDTGVPHEFYILGKGEVKIVFVPENCDEEELAKHYKKITHFDTIKK